MRKVLIITYYWPPSGGVGVQRWLKFSKYLPTHNWTPIIYTPTNPELGIVDESLAREIPGDVTVIKRPIWEPFQLYSRIFGGKGASTRQGMVKEGSRESLLEKLTIWLRGNLLLPDARKFWIKPSVKFLTRYLQDNPVDLIVSTGPPHSMHLIALGLKKKMDVKWVADFRDPWSQWDVLPRLKTSAWAMRKHRKMEKEVQSTCDLMLTVSPTLQRIYADQRIESELITNGFDFAAEGSGTFPDKFRITHAGLLNETKFHPLFWNILSDIASENEEFRSDLEISLAGNVSTSILNQLEQTGLGQNLVFRGFLDHRDILSFYEDSFVLLLFLNQTTSAPFLLPSKIFEYLKCRRFVLGFGPTESDSNALLTSVGLDALIPFDDAVQIRERITGYYDLFKQGKLPQTSDEVEQYSRASLTAEVARHFDRLFN